MSRMLLVLWMSLGLGMPLGLGATSGCRERGAGDADGHGHDHGGEHAGDHGDEHAGDHGDEHADEHAGDRGAAPMAVRISPRAVARLGIRVATVDSAPLAGGIEVPAEIQADPDRVAHVTPLVSGQLAEVGASLGARVQKGQTLAVLRSVQLGEARSALARARANVEVARSSFTRQEELAREGIGARRAYLEAQAELRRAEAELAAAQRTLEVYGRGGAGATVPIRSPIAGQVVARHATVGEVVGTDQALFQVTDIERVWVMGRAYQQHASALQVGAPAELVLQAYPGRSWQGSVDYVAPTLDERTRTLPVRMVLDNPDGLLRPGLFGTLSIAPPGRGREPVPVIQEQAVQRLDGHDVVFVPGAEEGGFRAVPVALGERAGGRVRVLSGLAPGERYVSDRAFVLKSELLRGQLGHGHAH